ncbi:MAG: hypothetical protein CVT79_10445 [Alphaproteobacteria bacterium HGW-Alphaproteobacteria-18]|nr:MAG: hypothetical protein CVT79_10445 [Alphaproteobacteria bacterium HGW-Alphaproteobacteria-18]
MTDTNDKILPKPLEPSFQDLFTQSFVATTFVYTMGKVGSSSVAGALLDANHPCYDVHHLQPERLRELLNRFLESDIYPTLPLHLIRSLQAYNALKLRRKITYITLIRDPVSHFVSNVLQNLPKGADWSQDAISSLLARYPTNIPDNWMKNELYPITGFDPGSARVDPTQDHFRFAGKDGSRVLMIKVECPDERKAAAIKNLLGFNITIVRKNVSAEKHYATEYAELLRTIGTSHRHVVEGCLEAEYFRIFYSEAERQAIADKYLNA